MRKLVLLVVIALALVACPGDDDDADAVEVVAAGDIATGNNGDLKTSNLVLAIDPAWAFTLGDNAYQDGTANQFNTFYDPTWGRFKNITKPAPGNHDHHTPGAAGYEGYFGPAFPASELVSYEGLVPGWDIYQVDTDSNLGAQVTALQNQLASNPDTCELVYGHHPRASSGDHGDNAAMDPLWDMLVAEGVDLLLSGHDHNYERFGKMNGSLNPDPNGTRQVVVGTGGVNTRPFGPASDGVIQKQLTGNTNWGVLDLELNASSYGATFRRVGSGGIGKQADSFSSACHA